MKARLGAWGLALLLALAIFEAGMLVGRRAAPPVVVDPAQLYYAGRVGLPYYQGGVLRAIYFDRAP